MYIIISVQGCWPHLRLERAGLLGSNAGCETDAVRTFKTFGEALSWASKHCAWSYKIIKWEIAAEIVAGQNPCLCLPVRPRTQTGYGRQVGAQRSNRKINPP